MHRYEHHNLQAAQSLCSSVARSCSDHLPICLRGPLPIGFTSTIPGTHPYFNIHAFTSRAILESLRSVLKLVPKAALPRSFGCEGVAYLGSTRWTGPMAEYILSFALFRPANFSLPRWSASCSARASRSARGTTPSSS